MYRFLKSFLAGLVYCFIVSSTPAVYCMDQQDVAYIMNSLLYSQGWQRMHVSIKDQPTNTVVASKVLYQPLNPDLPVTEYNINVKLRYMSVILSCNYAEIVWWYVEAVRLILADSYRNLAQMDVKKGRQYLLMTLQKIKNVRPMLMHMFSATTFINYMNVAVTVSKFEYSLWMIITHMDALYENHEFVLEPLPQTDEIFVLLTKLYESFRSAFKTYSMTVIEFVDEFCNVQVVPNREYFENYYRMYIERQNLTQHQMSLYEYLSTLLDSSIKDKLKNHYTGLAFKYDANTHKTSQISIAQQLVDEHS